MGIIDILSTSPKIKKIFSDLKLEMTPEVLEKNFKSLYEFLLDQDFDCSDLTKPCQRNHYIKKQLTYENNRFYIYDDYCEHYFVIHPFAKIQRKFLYQNVNMQEFDGSLKKIQETVDDFHDENYKKSIMVILKALLEIVKKDATKGLYIYGQPGVGKTHLLKAIAKRMAQNEKTVIISTMEALLADLHRAMDSEYNSQLLTVTKCQTVDVLFLDDIGLERATKWSRDEVLFPILNYRLEHKKLTFFSSNISLDDLKNHYGKSVTGTSEMNDGGIGSSRIIDRIKGMIVATFNLQGKSKR